MVDSKTLKAGEAVSEVMDLEQLILQYENHNLSDHAIVIEEFQIEVLSETALFAKYIAVFAEQNQKSFRSSIWIKRGNDWRMLYHQGTNRS